ncbi:MAG TPA: biphenyl 2,3-dioxygenase, partial [Gammaproteobacteria bacterium]|nr:biphenyl 2,3-dioxygenase [Gammaproteobacteria bacterium]
MKIHSLGYIGVNCTDPSRWAHYGTQVLGMMDVSHQLADDDSVYLKMDDRPWRIVIQSSDTDCYAFSGWEVAGPDDFADAINTLEQHGINFERAGAELTAQRRVQDLVSFTDPDGNRHEVYWGPIS